MPKTETPPLAATIEQIIVLGRLRLFTIKAQIRQRNATGGHIRTLLGWRNDLPEKESAAISARARALIAAIEKNQPSKESSHIVAAASGFVIPMLDGCRPYDTHRSAVEKELAQLGKLLPCWPLPKTFRGLSSLGLACIVACAGGALYDPSLFAHGRGFKGPGKLWKRLGLAPVEKDGVRRAGASWKRLGGLTAEDWTEAGYNGRRLAVVWMFVADVMLRAQWRGEKDGEAAHGLGPYGAVYAEKKTEYLAREGWTPKHADMAARRYMTKRVIRDLWRLWRAARVASTSGEEAPPATPSQD